MPRLTDDGSTLTLDVHGAHVEEAIMLVHKALTAALLRGRTSLRVIHGSSTSDPRARNRTIKHALHDLLDRNALPSVVQALRRENETLLGLPLGRRPDPARLHLADLR